MTFTFKCLQWICLPDVVQASITINFWKRLIYTKHVTDTPHFKFESHMILLPCLIVIADRISKYEQFCLACAGWRVSIHTPSARLQDPITSDATWFFLFAELCGQQASAQRKLGQFRHNDITKKWKCFFDNDTPNMQDRLRHVPNFAHGDSCLEIRPTSAEVSFKVACFVQLDLDISINGKQIIAWATFISNNIAMTLAVYML